jgi:hypothetical protein
VKYLIGDRALKRRAHIWTGSDTVCRLWSTGGLTQSDYSVHDDSMGRKICQKCAPPHAEVPRRCGLTRKEIMAKRTPAGGWTAAQLAEWGVSWPPRKGWINRLAGGAPRASAPPMITRTADPFRIGGRARGERL